MSSQVEVTAQDKEQAIAKAMAASIAVGPKDGFGDETRSSISSIVCASTRFVRSRWTPCRRPTADIQELRWRWRHWRLRCGPAICGTIRENPHWPGRDRFVLSNGHACMLLYSLLYLTGYDLSLDDIKQFRQWGSKTPGHPEYGLVPGAEATTGPLGQGVGNSVGMAIAQRWLTSQFSKGGHNPFDYRIYVFCGDGDSDGRRKQRSCVGRRASWDSRT